MKLQGSRVSGRETLQSQISPNGENRFNIKELSFVHGRLYTVQVNTGGDPLSTLLQNCAGGPDKFSDPTKFYMVTTSSGLGTVFNKIGTSLTQFRIAK